MEKLYKRFQKITLDFTILDGIKTREAQEFISFSTFNSNENKKVIKKISPQTKRDRW